MIRKAMIIGLALTSAGAFGQALTVAEQEINTAFAALRSASPALLRLVGMEYTASANTPIQSDFFYDRPTPSTGQDLRMELIEARNLTNARRVVADGRHVWGIDLVKNTYSSSRYGSYTATAPTDYEINGFQSLNVLATGQSALLAKMAREVWGGMAAQYRPWIPASSNRQEFTLQGTGATYPDPVVPTRIYASTATKKFHVYWNSKNGTPNRSVTFEMDDPGTGVYALTAIYYSDRITTRLVDWKTDIYTGVLPAAANFVYTPAAGTRAIAGPRPNGGG
jgi:hypothetical protein